MSILACKHVFLASQVGPKGRSLPPQGPRAILGLEKWLFLRGVLPSRGGILPSRGGILPSRGASSQAGGASSQAGGVMLASRGCILPSRGGMSQPVRASSQAGGASSQAQGHPPKRNWGGIPQAELGGIFLGRRGHHPKQGGYSLKQGGHLPSRGGGILSNRGGHPSKQGAEHDGCGHPLFAWGAWQVPVGNLNLQVGPDAPYEVLDK